MKFLVNDHASIVELMKEQLSTLQAELFPNVEVRLYDVSIHSNTWYYWYCRILNLSVKIPPKKYVT